MCPSAFSASPSNSAASTTNWQNFINGLIRSEFREDNNTRPMRCGGGGAGGGGGGEKISVVETGVWETTAVE
jgi:hypothetical protein